MKVEIKEILEFKENADYKRLSCDEIKVLRDYIINLQQENNNLKTSLDESQEVVIDLQERIEKAVEYINHLSKEPNVFGHYGIHNDCEKWLLNILNGRCDE